MERRKQNVLERLVNMEPWDLSVEAKVEKCRATRDLRSCGREVQHMLIPCGHASLCAECSQRCDVCPVCRIPITKQDSKLQLRLFDECLDAGLITFKDEDFKDKEGYLWTIDVQRLWSFFDVALENNLMSLICHYVTDVCMDEDAVSSDAVVSMLLDGAVVKEWCKRTFAIIVRSLRDIYIMGAKQMHSKLDMLDKQSSKLLGIVHILGALDTSVCDLASSPAMELQQLLEGVQRVLQHLGVMSWCARHRFLENIQSCHASINHWRTAMRERKSAAQERAWPDYLIDTGKMGSRPQSTLFIEDAMLNLIPGKDQEEDTLRDAFELGYLRQGNVSSSPSFRSRREWVGGQHGTTTLYPPESVRMAVDVLFLEGNSDLILAKKAIFLYYLFDRHWTLPDAVWRWILDDYVATFDIPRQAMLESLVFYLLDDRNEQALEEACRFLPDIVSGMMHPKVARVLLERRKPDAALWVLRCSGLDARLGSAVGAEKSVIPSLSEAVTAVRVRLECGLLTEAFLYQKSHCAKLKAGQHINRKAKKNIQDAVESSGCRSWISEMEALVGEICWLCIYRNLLDRMVELPWQAEEDTVRKCLLERATQDPTSSAGNFMVVYYLQRSRYVEAYLVHRRLCIIEQQFISDSEDEKQISHVRFACQQRTHLVEKSVELLPEIQRHDLRTGSLDYMLPDPLSGKDSGISIKEMDVDQAEGRPLTQARRPLSSPLFTSPLPSTTTKSEMMHKRSSKIDDVNATPPSGWGDFRQPSILHGQPFKSSSKGSSVLCTSDSSLANGLAAYGALSFSPILSRRLTYDGDSITVSQCLDQPVSLSVQKMLVSQDSRGANDQQREAIGSERDGFNLVDSKCQQPLNIRSDAGAEIAQAHGIENISFQKYLEADLLSRGQSNAQLAFENGLSAIVSCGPLSNSVVKSNENDLDYGLQNITTLNQGWPCSEERRQQESSQPSVLTNIDGYTRGQLVNLTSNGKRQPSDRSWLDSSTSVETSQRRVEKASTPNLYFKQDSLPSSFYSEDFQRICKAEAEIPRTRPEENGGIRWRTDDDDNNVDALSAPSSSGRLKTTSIAGRSIGRSRFFKHHVI